MPLNEAAKATIELLNTGAGSPLAPEHIGITRAAFPIYLDTVMNVTTNDACNGLVAIGFFDRMVCITWTSATGPDGWKIVEQPQPQPPKLSRFQRFILESRHRLRRAWGALMGIEKGCAA